MYTILYTLLTNIALYSHELHCCHLSSKVDTPRRKRGGGGSNDEAPKPAETPGEAIVKRLTTERMKEIRELLTKEGEEIRKLEKEVELLSSKDELTDAQLDEIQAR